MLWLQMLQRALTHLEPEFVGLPLSHQVSSAEPELCEQEPQSQTHPRTKPRKLSQQSNPCDIEEQTGPN